MTARDPKLQRVVDLTADCIAGQAQADAASAAARVFGCLAAGVGAEARPAPRHLSVCDQHLVPVMAGLTGRGGRLAELGRAFADLTPQLAWDRRKTSTPADQPFHDGHANATLIGPGGLEQRDDVWVGASLMAPGILYPDHSHPPEEVYLALSDGAWWSAEMDWTEPGAGGLIYNRPGVLHAMRSGRTPFLALWILPLG